MEITIPAQVVEIISVLNEHTYKAHLVGECVRGLVLGENPLDFDIITDAEMNRLLAIFEERFKTNTDYVNKGELIIINGAMGICVSPYRSRIAEDGKPIYCSDIDEDLKRRAFSANAVALSLDDGIYDPFGGYNELCSEDIILRAIVTEQPEEKKTPKLKKTIPVPTAFPVFENNPAAVLEAVQRYSAGGVEISPETVQNICECPDIIFKNPKEDFHNSFKSIILGKRVTDTMLMFREVIFSIIPKLRETDNFDQKSPVQEYPLYEHIAKSVGYAVPDYNIRLALLFHGIGKVDCAARIDEYTFYNGHSERGAMLTREIMTDLGFPAELTKQTAFLVLHHDDEINEENYPSFTAEYGIENVRRIILMRAADIRAKNSDYRYEQRSNELRLLADDIGKTGAETARRNSITLAGLKKLTENLNI